MQNTEKRDVFSSKEDEVKKEGFPWEMTLLISSLGLGVILVVLKIVGII